MGRDGKIGPPLPLLAICILGGCRALLGSREQIWRQRVLCGDGQTAAHRPSSERSVFAGREGIACSKLCLFVYHPLARHIGCVAAGKSDPSFGTMRTFVAVAVRDGAQAGLSRALSAAPLPR